MLDFHEYREFGSVVRKEDGEGYSGVIYRMSDCWVLDEWNNPSIKTKSQAIKECKIAIDDYHDNPQDYED